MKHIFLLTFVFAVFWAKAQGSMQINNGAELSSSGSATLTFNDYNLTNNGIFNLVDSGNVTFAGTNVQSVNGSGLTRVGNLIIENTAGFTCDNEIQLVNVLTPNNSTINFNDSFRFTNSSSDQVAQIAEAGMASLNGKVIIENYIPASRAFRFMSSTVTTDDGIRTNWQNGGTTISGVGTHITGSQTGANGLDQTISGNSSMFYWDEQTQNWSAESNTLNSELIAGKPIRMFVRGDRTVDLSNNNAAPTSTTLISRGTMLNGDVTNSFNTISGDFIMIANPYQAIVDIEDVLNDISTTGVNTEFAYLWDTTQNTRGAYITVDFSGTTASFVPSNSNATRYLRPGQALFLPVTGSSSITFKESHKDITASIAEVYRNVPVTTNRLDLRLKNSNGTILDEARIDFGSQYSNGITTEDAYKFPNLDESIAVLSNGNSLAISKMDFPDSQDRTPLDITNYRDSEFKLEIQVFPIDNISPVLLDNFLGTRTALSSGVNLFEFTVNSVTASADSNRFHIEYSPATLSNGDHASMDQIVAFPNPATDKITISSTFLSGKKVSYKLVNALGQIVFDQMENYNRPTVIDTSNLSKGMYILSITHAQKSKSIKVLKE